MLLSDLWQVEQAFWNNCKPFIDTNPDPETGRRFAKVRVTQPPPEMIHVLAAEIIYHLRSTLDQIAVRLAIMSGVSKGNLSKVYFPSGRGPKELVLDARGESKPRHRARSAGRSSVKRREGKIERLDRDLIKLILREKPYQGGDDELFSIFPLANIDKHVELIPAANHGQITGIDSFSVQNAIAGGIRDSGGNLYDGIKFSELGAHGTIEPRHPNARIQVSGQITFGNTKVYGGAPIVPVLNRLIQRESRLLDNVVNHCRSTGRLS